MFPSLQFNVKGTVFCVISNIEVYTALNILSSIVEGFGEFVIDIHSFVFCF
jgi:hypothetical protein